MHISRTCWISQSYSLKFMDQQPQGQWRCCVAYGQGQHGGVDASEWTRKCELAGIFYSCEYVHRAVLATLQSASAPYLEALTIAFLWSCSSSQHTRSPPSVPVTSLPTPPNPSNPTHPTHPVPFPLFSPQRQCSTSWRRRRRRKLISPQLSHFKTAWKKNLSNLLCLNATRYKG